MTTDANSFEYKTLLAPRSSPGRTALLALAVVTLLSSASWTQSANRWPNDPVSCDNSAAYPCVRWRKTSSNLSITIDVYLDSSLTTQEVNLRTDAIEYVIPAWNGIAARNPHLEPCTNINLCSDYQMRITALDIGTDGVAEMAGMQTGGAPAYFYYAVIRMNTRANWNRSMICSGLTFDSRKAMSHEMGHAQALGHTGITPAIMKTGCYGYWRPQENDIAGIQHIYGAYP